MNKFFRVICILQLLVSSGICIFLSDQENVQLPDLSYADKFFHCGAYFIYGLSLQVAIIAFFINKSNYTAKRMRIIVLILGCIFAMSDEIHQYFVPNRSADVLDFLVDALGILLSLLLFHTINKIEAKIIHSK
jgi:VanZ family protein